MNLEEYVVNIGIKNYILLFRSEKAYKLDIVSSKLCMDEREYAQKRNWMGVFGAEFKISSQRYLCQIRMFCEKRKNSNLAKPTANPANLCPVSEKKTFNVAEKNV